MGFSQKPDLMIVDLPSSQLRREFKTFDTLDLIHAAGMDVERSVRRKVRAEESMLRGEDAGRYLAKLIPLAVEETVKIHSPYGRLRWLWYLRRIPSELLEGEYATTLGYDRALAEALTWGMPESDVKGIDSWIRFPVNRSVCRHICQLIGRVKFISSLHIMYRRVGKGAYLDLRGERITAINDESVDQAISAYDQRQSEGNAIFGQAYGLSPHEFDVDQLTELDDAGDLKLFIVMPCRPLELPINRKIPGQGERRCLVRAHHIPWVIDGKAVLDPLELGAEWERLVLRRFACLLQMSLVLPVFFAELDQALDNCLKTGYFVVGEGRAANIIDRSLPQINNLISDLFPVDEWPTTYDQWREAALSFTPETWPLEPGGVLRSVGEKSLLIDAVTMTLALNRGLGLDRSESNIANYRADLFETQCQSVVDQSRWQPPSELSRLRGKPLKRDRRHLTDIDAIGAIGGTLLCISCKSVVYDALYDMGDYRVVQNNKSRIDQAVQAWFDLIDELKYQPRGDNFDFSHYSEIIGVVCTPFVVYTDNPEALGEVAPGLRACVAIGELRTWLNSGGYTP